MTTKFAEAVKAVQSLPQDRQEAIADEMLQQVEDYLCETSDLTPEQIAIIDDRLSRPFEYASDEKVKRVLGQLNIKLPPHVPNKVS